MPSDIVLDEDKVAIEGDTDIAGNVTLSAGFNLEVTGRNGVASIKTNALTGEINAVSGDHRAVYGARVAQVDLVRSKEAKIREAQVEEEISVGWNLAAGGDTPRAGTMIVHGDKDRDQTTVTGERVSVSAGRFNRVTVTSDELLVTRLVSPLVIDIGGGPSTFPADGDQIDQLDLEKVADVLGQSSIGGPSQAAPQTFDLIKMVLDLKAEVDKLKRQLDGSK